MAYFQDNQLAHNDRSSVIQHTMQHIREINMQNQLNEMEVPNQLMVSVNSNAAEQIRNVPKNVINLPPFKVNIADKSISNSSLAVSANLVIARKPQSVVDVSCQQTSSSVTSSRTVDTITIPGILASPSVIVSPWEAQRKVHGELLYKKNKSMSNSSTTDKRFYKNRLPYEKKLPMPEAIMLAQRSVNENNSTPVSKTYAKTYVKTNQSSRSPVNQTLTKTSQTQAIINKSPSLEVVASLLPSSAPAAPPVTSSQPWYSEPFPKPINRKNDVSVSSSSTNIQKSVQPNIQVLSPVRLISDSIPFTLYTSQRHQGKNQAIVIPTVTSTLSTRVSIPVSSLAASSSVHNTNTLSTSTAQTTTGNNTEVKLMNYNSPSSSNNRVQIRTYSAVQKPVKINSAEKSGQMQLITNPISIRNQAIPAVPDVKQKVLLSALDRNQVTHVVPVVRNASPKCSQASSEMYPEACCSPSEVNPCQSCSLPSGNSLTLLNEKESEDPSLHSLPSSKEMVLDNALIAAISHDSNLLNIENNSRHQLPEPIVSNCQFCSQPFLETDLQTHILNCPSHEFNMKNRLIADMESNFLASENPFNKSLPDVVPEQDSLFQKESFQSDIPHTKTFINEVDDKNLDEIEANAFNACMDLINNDNDLQRMVQGIDSFDQIDNNFLSYLPPPNTANYVSSCNDTQKDMIEVPLQNNIVLDENELNNYASNCDSPLQMDQRKFDSVFEFTEKEDEASRAAENFNIAEMIKASLQENGCSGELESVETIIKDNQKDFIYLNEHTEKGNTPKKIKKTKDQRALCPYCARILSSSGNLKRHIASRHPNPSVKNLDKVPPTVDVASSADKSVCDFQVKNEVSSASGNSLHDSNSSLNYILNSDMKHDNAVPSTSEVDGSAKGRIKSNLKRPTSSCKFCGKILTLLYMKTHISKKHKDLINSENISCANNDTSVNIVANQNIPIPEIDSVTIPVVPSVLEQDIDSSTCLSVSDALKRNTSYNLAEDSPSPVESKIEEQNNVKFDFNELELSKHVTTEPKIMASAENPATGLNNPLLENINNFRDNTMSVTSNNQLAKCLDKRHSCIMCGKSYNSTTSLNRHLKTVHKVLPAKPQKRSMKTKVNVIEKVKVEENQLASHSNFPSVAKSDVDIAQTSAYSSKEIPNATACNTSMNMVERAKEKFRNPVTLNANRNLLRAVLQSNFVKDHTKLSEQNDVSVQDINNGKSKTLAMDPDCNANAANGSCTTSELKSSVNNVLAPKLESDDKMVPSETSMTVVKDNLYSVIPGTELNTSLDANLQDNANLNFEMPLCNLNPDIKFSNLSDTVNSSCQSNEISPVSEIISNVSRCNFGGTSNDKNAEIFEDNSLKLPIPENKEISSSSINNDQSYNLDQNFKSESYEMDDDQGNSFRVFEERNIQEPLSPNLNKGYFDEDYADFECKKEVSGHQNFSSNEYDIFDNHQDNDHANHDVTEKDSLCSEQNIVNNDQFNLFGNQNNDIVNCHQGNCEEINKNQSHYLNAPLNAENDCQRFYSEEDIVNANQDHSCDEESVKLEDLSNKGEHQVDSDQVEEVNTNEENKINGGKDNLNDEKVIVEEDKVVKQEDLNTIEKYKVDTDQVNTINTDEELQMNCGDEKIGTQEDKVMEVQESMCDEVTVVEEEINKMQIVMKEDKVVKDQESMCGENIGIKELNNTDIVIEEDKVIKDQENICGESVLKHEDDMHNDNIQVADNQGDSLIKNKMLTDQDDLLMLINNQDISDNEQDCSNDDQHILSSSCSNEEEIVEDESYEFRNTTQSPKNCVMCRFCLQNLDSMETLSKHLKEAHNIPVLKRQISEPSSPEKLADTDEIGKLSPPKLKLGTSESDSESVSNSENAYSYPNVTQDSLDLDISKNKINSEGKKMLVPPPPFLLKENEQIDEIAENTSSPMSKNLKHEEISIKNIDYSNSPAVETSNSSLIEKQEDGLTTQNLSVFKSILDPEETSVKGMEISLSGSAVVETSNSSYKDSQQDEEVVTDNSSSTSKNVFKKDEISVKDTEFSLSDSFVETSNCSLPEVKYPSKSLLVKLNKCDIRKPSLSGKCAFFTEKYNDRCSPLVCNSENSSLDFKNSSYNKLKRKSVSLPNLSAISDEKTNNLQHEIQITEPMEVKNENGVINSGFSDENSSLDSMFNNTNSSENTSESLSSLNNSVQWDKITINSSFILPTKVSASVPQKTQPKTVLRSKFSGRKLIIQRLRTYEKQKKFKRKKKSLFTRHKVHKPKITCNPTIMTLEKAADVNDFLKTHKQPVIKLIRLKDSDLDFSLNEKDDPVSKTASVEKIPVVKLERLPVSAEIDKMVVLNQNHFIPNLLSQKTHLSTSSMQSVEDTSNPSSFYQDSSDGGISTDVSSPLNLPAAMPIELSDDSCSSSDSIQFIGSVSRRDKRIGSSCSLPLAKKCFTLPSKKKCITLPSRKKCFTLPSTKKCFVVLNRIPV